MFRRTAAEAADTQGSGDIPSSPDSWDVDWDLRAEQAAKEAAEQAAAESLLREQALKEESEESDEWSEFGEYIGRSPSPTSPSLKRRASTPLAGASSPKKIALEIAAEALRSTILSLPPNISAVREDAFSLAQPII